MVERAFCLIPSLGLSGSNCSLGTCESDWPAGGVRDHVALSPRGDCHLQDVMEAIPDELSLPAHNQADNRMTEACQAASPAKTSPDQQDHPTGL